MRVNTNINLRNRSRVELKNFKGLDTLSSPVEVSSIHGMECENLISRDGVNHKRYGWKSKWKIADSSGNVKQIHSIFNFSLDKGETSQQTYKIAYAGGVGNVSRAFWQLKDDGTASNISSGISPFYPNCKCFVNGDKAYFVGTGGYYELKASDSKIKDVKGNAYIPTTTENIGSEEKGQHYTRITAEERNLLSQYVYNTLFGDECEGDEISTYYLDYPGAGIKEITIDNGTENGIKLTPDENVEQNTSRLYNGATITTLESALFTYSTLKTSTIGVQKTELVDVNDKEINRLVIPDKISAIEFTDGSSVKLIFSYDEENLQSQPLKEYMGYVYFTPILNVKIAYFNGDGTMEMLKENIFNIPVEVNLSLINGNIKTDWVMNLSKIGEVTLSLTNKTVKNITAGQYYHNEATVKIINANSKVVGEYNKAKAILRMYPGNNDFAPPYKEKPNIKVKLSLPNDLSAKVTSATNGCKFGLGGSDDRLFLINDNVVMWSKDEDFTYFGEKSWCVCGTKETKITGIDRLNDSTLLIVKEYSVNEPSVYIISGRLDQALTEGGTIDYQAVFTPKGYQVGMGAVGELTNFNGDCLMVCKDGVYSVMLGENMTVDARYIHHRSRQITNLLAKYDLSKAKCISCNGKYYLAINGDCYVADNKYLASFKGDMQNVPNYEWWKWTNMPVNCWGYVDNELCFGTTNGEICVFTDKFYDEGTSITKLGQGGVTYKTNDNNEIIGVIFSNTTTLKDGDVLISTNDYYGKVITNKFEVVNGKTRLNLPLNDYKDKDVIYINNTRYDAIKYSTYMEIDYDASNVTTLEFYKNYKDVQLKLKSKDDYYALLYNGEEVIGSPVYQNGQLAQNNFNILIPQKTPIVAKWITGALDLGTRSHAKTLTKLIMTGEKDLANHLKYGIKTRVTNRNYEFLRANNDLDFENLDLETLSLDSQFASSFVKRLNLRNVNFIQLYLMNDTEEDMAINSIELEYKIIKNNIGVN